MFNKHNTTAAVEYNLADKHFDRSAIEKGIDDIPVSIETIKEQQSSSFNIDLNYWDKLDGNRSYLSQYDDLYSDYYEEMDDIYQQHLLAMADADEPEIDLEELRAFWAEKEALSQP